MFFYDGYVCPVCEKAFLEQDDIVACPACGAPHHRACWQEEGQCHFADLHGTPEQWSRQAAEQAAADARKAAEEERKAAEEERICPSCGHHNPSFAEFCAHCGKHLETDDWATDEGEDDEAFPPTENDMPFSGYREYTPYHVAVEDPAEGISPQERLEDVSARDMAAAVGTNVAYYLPRFRRFEETGARCSWNWSAFAFTSFWLFLRKNYLAGSLILFLEIATAALTSFIRYQMFPSLGSGTVVSYEDFQAFLQGITDLSGLRPLIALYLLAFVLILTHVFLGLFGNRLYYHTCLTRVRRFRKRNPDGYPAELTALGGTSMMLGVIAYFARQFIGYILLSLLSLLL